MRTFLLLLLSLFLIRLGQAQSSLNNQLSLRLGLQQHLVADQQASPLRYQGQLPSVGLDFTRKYSQHLLHLEAKVASGAFDARAYAGRTVDYGEIEAPLQGTLTRGTLTLRYLRQVQKNHTLRTHLGLGLQQRIDYPGAEPYVGLVALSSIPVVARIEKNWAKKHYLQAQASYALGGVFTRLPWWHTSLALPEEHSQFKAFYRNNTQWAWGTQLTALEMSLGYQYQIGAQWRMGAQYGLSFLQYQEPQQLQIFNQNLNVQLAWLF